MTRSFVPSLAGCLAVVAGLALPAVVPAQGTYARVTLEGSIVELKNPYELFGGGGWTLREVTDMVDGAAKDVDVAGLVLEARDIDLSVAAANELHDHLVEFRKSGKTLIVTADYLDAAAYFAFAPADHIVLPPVSGLEVYGLSADLYFMKDMLGKIGVEAQAIHTGPYKNAMESFTHSEMTPATREQTTALVEGIADEIVERVAKARSTDPADTEKALWGGPYSSRRALEAGLITDVDYPTVFLDDYATSNSVAFDDEYYTPDTPDTPQLDFFSLFTNAASRRAESKAASTKAHIAVIHAQGPIVDGRASENPLEHEQVIAADDFLDLLDEVMEDGPPSAIVLRVDSPGGSALASDRIWHALRQIRTVEGVPIVVSMGDVAASGGYYIGMAGDWIVAQPTTITGSIGVVGGRLAFGGTYDWIGMNKQSITVGPNAGILDESRPWNPEEVALLEGLLAEVYDEFLTKAAESRSKDIDALREVADGHVWTGRAALGHGLIDELGGLEQAIVEARRRAKAPNAELQFYPREKSFFEVFEELFSGASVSAASTLGERTQTLARWRQVREQLAPLTGSLPAGAARQIDASLWLMMQPQPQVLAIDATLPVVR